MPDFLMEVDYTRRHSRNYRRALGSEYTQTFNAPKKHHGIGNNGRNDSRDCDRTLKQLRMVRTYLVSGGTQAGKTTLLNALVSETPLSQRVITIEEVFELQPRVPDLIQMQTRGA
jgi:hypothetical protein